MANLRKYGHAPFRVVVIHGGPGAPGEMAPVARELSSDTGVLEPLQTASDVEGQVQDLKGVIEKDGTPPLTLLGFSWGAWLAYIFTAYYSSLVRKILLVGSGPFGGKYAAGIMATRLGRLDKHERREVLGLLDALDSGKLDESRFARFGELMNKADAYDPLPGDDGFPLDPVIYLSVWPEAVRLRESGQLLRLGEKIKCPVVAIHGDYDPHPAEGVREPLSHVIKDFRFILLRRCGHRPWLEREAKDAFYRIIKREIQ